MKSFPNVYEINYYDVNNKDFQLKGKWKQAYFKNNNPIVVELACGKGEYTINLAKTYPSTNFIGIDIKGARMYVGAKKALNENMANVLFIRTRIEFLHSIFDNGEINEIWLTFPDPQEKKSNSKKRLTSSRFLNMYKNILSGDRIVNLKTDNTILYNYTKNILITNNTKIESDIFDVYNTPSRDKILDIKTYYESMFLNEGKEIHYLRFKLNKDIDYIEPEELIGR